MHARAVMGEHSFSKRATLGMVPGSFPTGELEETAKAYTHFTLVMGAARERLELTRLSGAAHVNEFSSTCHRPLILPASRAD